MFITDNIKRVPVIRFIISLFFGRRTRGYIIVDAACTLPVFILAMCTLLSLINQAGLEDKLFADLVKGADKQALVYAAGGKIIDSDYLVNIGHTKNLVIQKVTYRPFWGEEHTRMKDGTTVYVFPKRGIRYHVEGCSIMKDGQIELILNKKVRKQYSSCKICKPGDLPDGAMVCVYGETSEVYHRKSCASVTKTYEVMEKSEAEKQGYSPCLLCIGKDGAGSGAGMFDPAGPDNSSGLNNGGSGE